MKFAMIIGFVDWLENFESGASDPAGPYHFGTGNVVPPTGY